MSQISLTQIRRAAAEGRLDERTVRKVLSGAPTRPMVRERALDALKAVGVAELDIEQIIAAKGNAVRLGEIADGVARAGRRSQR
ncbi:MAG TPA: hypothetical protein VHK47_11405 [Polyangia bacterium]|nr:hypothetical protein [Polyangia bacterium]